MHIGSKSKIKAASAKEVKTINPLLLGKQHNAGSPGLPAGSRTSSSTSSVPTASGADDTQLQSRIHSLP